MDRRQRKTREAIFNAFSALLTKKDYNKITVGEIISDADVGRATFYAHFETKDYLLKEFCEELFCHIFDAESGDTHDHRHIFDCKSTEPVFLHLLQHLQHNDHNILSLLSCTNNELFLKYFRASLEDLISSHMELFARKKDDTIPEGFWKNHISATFVETVSWWISNGKKESPEVIADFFFKVV